MKILVFSDSHSGLSFMRACIDSVKPNALVHLGDYYDDAETIAEQYPHITLYQVPGNCDRYRCPPFARETMIQGMGGVSFYLTHGHNHQVKMTKSMLLRDARAAGVAAVLYGHTHIPDCYQEEDGLWVLNPGSCGSWGGSAGLIETDGKKIISCRLLRLPDLEE